MCYVYILVWCIYVYTNTIIKGNYFMCNSYSLTESITPKYLTRLCKEPLRGRIREGLFKIILSRYYLVYPKN